MPKGKYAAARTTMERVAALGTAEYWVTRASHVLFPFQSQGPTFDELTKLQKGLQRWDVSQVPERLLPVLFLRLRELYPSARRYYLGLVRTSTGGYEGALRTAKELNAMEPSVLALSVAADLARSIRAEIKRRQGHPEAALKELQAWEGRASPVIVSTSLYSAARERFLRAELLADRGEFKKALQWYRSSDGLFFGELPYLAPARLDEAQALEALGRSEDAVRAYRRFLDLWHNADEELQPRVEAARERLKELPALEAETND